MLTSSGQWGEGIANEEPLVRNRGIVKTIFVTMIVLLLIVLALLIYAGVIGG